MEFARYLISVLFGVLIGYFITKALLPKIPPVLYRTEYKEVPANIKDTVRIWRNLPDKHERQRVDTVEYYRVQYKDSIVYVAYNSTVPLDSSGFDFWEIRYNNLPQIDLEQPKITFWNRFSFSIQAGFGYGVFNKKPDLFVGLGIGYKL